MRSYLLRFSHNANRFRKSAQSRRFSDGWEKWDWAKTDSRKSVPAALDNGKKTNNGGNDDHAIGNASDSLSGVAMRETHEQFMLRDMTGSFLKSSKTPSSLKRASSFALTEAPLDIIQKAKECLSPLCMKERLQRMETVLQQRTSNIRFVFENPTNPNNVWACLRTLDAFGVQHVHVIIDPSQYSGKASAAVTNINTAMGSAKWLTIHRHSSAADCAQHLRTLGFRLVASDLHGPPEPTDVQDVEWGSQGRTAIIIGNEERGISSEMRGVSDSTYRIPMKGMVESLNMSAAVSVTLAVVFSKEGMPQDLSGEEKERLFVQWLINSTGQAAIPVLKRAGLLASS